MLYICILSNKIDLKQTIRVLHTSLICTCKAGLYPSVAHYGVTLWLLALVENIGLGSESLQGTNSLAHFTTTQTVKIKKVVTGGVS